MNTWCANRSPAAVWSMLSAAGVSQRSYGCSKSQVCQLSKTKSGKWIDKKLGGGCKLPLSLSLGVCLQESDCKIGRCCSCSVLGLYLFLSHCSCLFSWFVPFVWIMSSPGLSTISTATATTTPPSPPTYSYTPSFFPTFYTGSAGSWWHFLQHYSCPPVLVKGRKLY